MLLKAYSVFDVKAGAYLPPFFMVNDAVAKRAFSECCNDSTHMIGKHPDDFILFLIGEFDDALGVFSGTFAHQNLGSGLIFLERDEK